MSALTSFAPVDAYLPGLGLALAIGLLLGVERGWRMREEAAGERVAGIRTFALLGLLGGLAGIALAGPGGAIALIAVGGAVAALLIGYAAEIRRDHNLSATSALAGILALTLGAMATTGTMAAASVGAGAAVILLASREALHRAVRMTSETDIKALLRLVLVAFVILPLLPDRGMGPFSALNPFRLWTVVVVTSGISFAGYVLVRRFGEQRGALATAAVGSLVSSTAVTVDSARRIRDGAGGATVQAGVAVASTIMLTRSLVLVSIIAPIMLAPFATMILPGLAVSALASAALLYRAKGQQAADGAKAPSPPGLGLALLFAASVALLSIASAWAQGRWGGNSGAILIALGGTADIDAAIATVGALPPGRLPVGTAAIALAAPTFLNTLFKLCLFTGIAGVRRSMPGALALGAISAALLVPIALALT